MNNNDISGEIVIPSQNKMSVKYRVIGQDISESFAEIDVIVSRTSDVLAEVTPRVGRSDDVSTEINIMHGVKIDTLAEIQPIIGDNVLAEIIVFPGNVMSAIFEVKDPPKITAMLNPAKDSLTRSASPHDTINYGKNNSLSVGKYQNETYESYIQFDLSILTPQHVITDSRLRLYYLGEIPQNAELELLAVDGNWSEQGVTYRNRPLLSDVISTTFTNNALQKYVEFEFTDITAEWIQEVAQNNGFVVRSSDETTPELISFRSRETTRPPELIVTYYDSKVYSAGRTQITSEIVVAHGMESDIFAEVEVSSTIGHSETFAELYVHRYEDPVDRDIEAEITVTRESTLAEIAVSVYGESEILAEISLITPQISGRDTDIVVSKVKHEAEIFIPYTDDVESEIIVQRSEDDDILAEISVTREYLDAEIEVKYSDDILAEITIEAHEDIDIPSEISISRESTLAEIEVYYKDDIESEITVTKKLDSDKLSEIVVTREAILAEIYVKNTFDTLSEITVTKRKDDDIDSELVVTKEYVYAEIIVKGLAESDVESEIIVRVQDDSDVDTEIIVTREQILAEITVVETSNIDAEIYVRHNNDALAEINVHVSDSVLAEINVVKVSEKLAEVTATRTSVNAEIMVPYYGDSDVFAEVSARVLGVGDVFTEIVVKSKIAVGESYAFII